MNTSLKDAFENYIKIVTLERNNLLQKPECNIYKITFNEAYEINKFVSILENNESFYNLASKTKETYFSMDEELEDEGWIDIVKTFFRKSEFYYNCYKNKNINNTNLFNAFKFSLEQDSCNLYYIAPLGCIKFPIDLIQLDTFKLAKLSEFEIENIIKNKTLEIFYPNCFLGNKYLEGILDNHSILFSKSYKLKGLRGIDYNYIYYGIPGNIEDYKDYLKNWLEYIDEIRYINYPNDLLPILHRLSLFDWDHKDEEVKTKTFGFDNHSRGGKFFIPFVIISDDCLISSPYGRGGLSGGVMRQPNSPNFFIHSYEIENILLGPTLNEIEVEIFISFVNKIGPLINEINIEGNDLDFLERSLNSFVKAFFSNGFEELLWQIISLETLVGDKGDKEESLTKRMHERISAILGGSEKEEKKIKKHFKDIYELRSKLVHGSKLNYSVDKGLLREGRFLCRKTLLWFLHFLSKFQKQTRGKDIKLSQKDVNALIDFARYTGGRLNKFIAKQPANFPYFPDWIE
jgi:hypothetical protein